MKANGDNIFAGWMTTEFQCQHSRVCAPKEKSMMEVLKTMTVVKSAQIDGLSLDIKEENKKKILELILILLLLELIAVISIYMQHS